MQGTVIKVAVQDGQRVAEGDLVVVLEAMKMENPVAAHQAGVVTGLAVGPSAFITQGAPITRVAPRRLPLRGNNNPHHRPKVHLGSRRPDQALSCQGMSLDRM
jgi:hypothetical protein